MSKDPKKVVEEIVSMVGKPKAERLLIAEEVSPSMATKLVGGKYRWDVSPLYAAAIERARRAAKELAKVS